MRAEEWEEIKRIFESALNLSDSERAAFLDAACANSPALRQTVDELLRAHWEASGFLAESTRRQLPAVFQPGQLVAERFRIIRLISRGGMGEVYETFDERLSVRLALKTLRPEFASDADALERFRREIRITRDFGHPNLCRVYELVEHRLPADDSQSVNRVVTCLTMQLMSGETLQQYLARAGPLSPQEALPLIEQMAGAISALHENGIIHRDLKPSNIMITPASGGELRAIVMDFGLAKPFATDQELFESGSDFHAGAPFFLAPELVAGEKPSVASDVYAFGLIIDEMVTTGGAFAGDTVEAILYQKLWGEPKDPQSRAPALPENWAKTIRRCLQREPEARFVSARDAIRELTVPSLATQPLPGFYKALRALTQFSPKLRRSPSILRARNLVFGSFLVAVAGTVSLGFIGSRPLNTSVLTFQFENLTGKSQYDYLCKGTTREVERRLLQLPGVYVMPYHEPPPKEASIKTTARFSIEGQLEAGQKAPRLSVSVIENSTGRLICCANTFENDLADPLEMQ
ncbi:MAG TPA: serine/threonine-protein kinase, partial [Bryobacteraceae bacterium]